MSKEDKTIKPVSQNRTQQVTLNNEIALCAKRKDLDGAMTLFKSAISQGIANSHTYAAAVNANIRCGSLDGAESVMTEMSANGRRKDVIICTTLMKGYCGDGQIKKALSLLDEMSSSKPVILPNIRTINTFLRGCVQVGDIDNADLVLTRAIKDLRISPDVSSWEYMVVLLCQGLRLDKALPIVGRLRTDPEMASGMVNMNVNIARAAALLGEWKTCRRALSAAKELLGSQLALVDGAVSTSDNKVAVSGSKTQVVGGKRAWRAGPGADLSEGASEELDQRRLQSLELFRAHSREEMRADIAVIEDFVVCRQQQQQSSVSAFQHLFPYFLRIFSFSSELASAGAELDREALLAETMRHADSTFGLGTFVQRLSGQTIAEIISVETATGGAPVEVTQIVTAETAADSNTVKTFKKKSKKAASAKPTMKYVSSPAGAEVVQAIQGLRAALDKRLNASGRINFTEVFESTVDKEVAKAASTRRLLKMEVCSGAGEWAVAQASADPQSDWVTLELRHDRVYQTFTRAVFAGARNLCILGGDAMRILPSRVGDGVVDRLFVNHPEPPQQTGGVDSQGKHLLTPAFFAEANRILTVDGGMLTIVTDNLWYGRFLMRQVAAGLTLAGSWSSALVGSSPDWRVQDSDGEVNLFVGRPGLAAGHVVDASSYFDRLWKRDSLVNRYFLVLKKSRGGVAGGAALTAAARQRQQISASLKQIVAKPYHCIDGGSGKSTIKSARDSKHRPDKYAGSHKRNRKSEV